MGTFTFVSRKHDKSYAWHEFIKEYSTCEQHPVAIMPGHVVAYTNKDISKAYAEHEAR
jgi:hypothetical protein